MPNTMDFSTAWSKRPFDWLRCLLLALNLALAGSAWAQIEVTAPQLVAIDDGYAVSADFALELNPRLEEAVNKGVVLSFQIEFELNKARWYWFDEKLLSRQKDIRLSYHALTRQYRVSSGGLHQSFSSLSEALRVMSRLRNWLVIEKSSEKGNDKLKVGDAYLGTIRFRHDISQLPKPFQIAAVGSKEWTLASEWKSWQFSLPPSTLGESK